MEDREILDNLEDCTVLEETPLGAEQKHFRLTNETKYFNGHTLYRIECIEEFDNGSLRICVGDKGGFVEKEENLCGNAWVYDNAFVYDDAIVRSSAGVHENARVFGTSIIGDNARIYGNALVYGKSVLCDYAIVRGNARVIDSCLKEDSIIDGHVDVVDSAIIGGGVVIDGSEKISRDAEIAEKNDYIFFASVGSRNDNLTVYRTKYGGVRINIGCFHGSIDEFKHSVLITHANNEKVRKEYLAIIEIIKNRFDIDI